MNYSLGNLVFLFGSITSGTLLSILQTVISKDRVKSISDNFLYQMFIYVTCALIMAIFGGFGPYSVYTLFLGVISGLLIVVETACTLEAFRCGSMALTNLFVMAAMIVPIIPARVLWGEKNTPEQIAGTVLTLCSMVLILNLITEFSFHGEKRENSSGISKNWLIFAFAAFLSAGLQGIVQKYLAVSDLSSELMSFLFVGFTTASLFTAILLVFFVKIRNEPVDLEFRPNLLLSMLVSGVLMGTLHLTFIHSLECLPITLAFAGSCGARLILLTVADMLLFRQKLSKEQFIGICVGVIAIVFTSL